MSNSKKGTITMRRIRLAAAALTVSLMTLAASCSSGPSAADIAQEACTLARQVASGQVGVLSLTLQANEIRKKASDNNISFSDVLSEASKKCPDVIDQLGL